MEITNVFMNISRQSGFPADFDFADILIPSIQKGMMAQTHFFLPASDRQAVSVQMSLKGAEECCKPELEAAKEKLSIGRELYPYGFSEAQWWEYCLAPHSYLGLGEGRYQVGLNLFNRFLHVDIQQQTSYLLDPKVGNEMLSSTNWFDPDRQEIWFASWPIEATVRRMLNPQDYVETTIWRYSISAQRSEEVWRGNLGDSLHQLSLSPDRRFLILTELGLRFSDPIPGRPSDQDPVAWKRLRENGLIPSEILVLDLNSNREWRLPMPVAGHVEYDPADPEICYLSGHNIGLFGVKVGIFGEGVIRKYRLQSLGPELLAEFTHPRFHRITTHIVFRHRERTLIGVSGYPGAVFLIDAASMRLYKILEMDAGDVVDVSEFPHICRADSYGIAASNDGEFLLVAGSGFLRVADVADGRFVFYDSLDGYGDNSCFTGHMGHIEFSGKE